MSEKILGILYYVVVFDKEHISNRENVISLNVNPNEIFKEYYQIDIPALKVSINELGMVFFNKKPRNIKSHKRIMLDREFILNIIKEIEGLFEKRKILHSKIHSYLMDKIHSE
jgi:hypothetical protein